MNFFDTLHKRIDEAQSNKSSSLKLQGIDANLYGLFLSFQKIWKTQRNGIYIFPAQDQAEEFFDLCKNNFKNNDFDAECLLLTGHDHGPYGGYISSERSLFERFYALQKALSAQKSKKPILIFTTMEALHLKNPPQSLLDNQKIKIEVSDIISPNQLKSQLVARGYQHSFTIEEPGTFSHKGEIFDLYPADGLPVRIHYFDDMIEEIFPIDKESLKSVRDKPLEKIEAGMSPRVFCRGDFSTNLRASIPMPPVSHRPKFERRKKVFESLSNGFLFENYPTYIPLFCKTTESIFDYLDIEHTHIHLFNSFRTIEEWSGFLDEIQEDYLLVSEDSDNDCLLPGPEKFYETNLLETIGKDRITEINEVEISVNLADDINSLKLNYTPFKTFIGIGSNPNISKADLLKETFDKIHKHFDTTGRVVFFHSTQAAKEEFIHLLNVFEIPPSTKSRISYSNYPLERGLYYEKEKALFLTEADLFSIKKRKVKDVNQKDLDLFAEQLATLQPGDYVIHNEHGVGKYLGLESLDLSEEKSDFLVLEYSGKDKVYVPVYKMNLIQKHANAVVSLSLDSLRNNKFSTLKKRASQSIKKLAFDLLKLQAERESAKAFSFSPPDHYYNEFELAFPFQETPDQRMAISNVLEDMQKERPMDHLVCGDVGFGKTEVAIRAAFKAVLDHKQVAVLVPTTILALQHYNSFKKRLKGFPVSVEFVSRFKTAKETKEILEKLAEGKIDILIGTHKLLSDKIKYKDLGLVVVDEEQRFGVGHKEKLKLLKANVDFLTLTATPIPRTLQLSFLGLRDLSLIKTPPPKRQSIKTYIIKEDPLTLQTAIKKELNRGGQVFIVHNRVNDIEDFAAHIRELVPGAKIVIGHGQLAEKELEKRMQAFYKGEYQILIATTIIESGIDIPNANTMIVDRADTYGLSQLHQLRGRIGRSDKKAYAYFLIPNNRNITNVAEKRLKALQTYAEMGSGFNIASCDLEIRGAGDILGASQSGHIEAIGLELYMELLQDAIRDLKGEKKVFNKNLEISAPFPSYIPNHYIADSSERLRQYKILSNTKSLADLETVFQDLQEIYGPAPIEFKNLKTLLDARVILLQCGIKTVQLNPDSISIQFDKGILDNNKEMAANVAQTFLNHPKLYHFSPDYKVLYRSKSQLHPEDFLAFCHKIAEQIVPC